MPQLPCPPTLARHIRPPWQAPGGPAGTPLSLLPALVRRQPELLPHFTAYYAQLRALPRRVRRALQRQWRLSLVGIALVLALGQQPALAATIPVSAGCTLVDAITAANTDTATGGCPAGSGTDTILLPAGSTQTLTEVNNETYGATGLPVISSVITIAGQGSTITRDPEAPEFRLLAVNSTGDLTLQESTVSGGVSPTLFENGSFLRSYNGGGVANYGGTLTVTNSIITSNFAEYGGGDGNGGGVYNSGILTITHSIITSNFAEYGGGVGNFGGTCTVTNSTLAGNAAFGGAGVANGSRYIGGGTLTVTNSTISGNSTASGGGGGVLNGGTLTVTNSTLAGNFGGGGAGVAGGGGALVNVGGGTGTVTNSTLVGNAAGEGGGVVNDGTLTVTNSILSGNFTNYGSGGGVTNSYTGTLTLTNSTIAGNAAYNHGGGIANFGTFTLTNSTIAGNAAEVGGGGGISNHGATFGTFTVINSTIAGNAANWVGGGVYNSGTLTVTNSTISGNSSAFGSYSGGGGVANGGTCTVTNSTIAGNAAFGSYGGGGVMNDGTVTLTNSTIAGNAAPTGLEIHNRYGTVIADNHNLFGVNGTAGIEGFSPGATDIVPPVGVQLADILDPTLAFHGGPTQTHALVPGSPAIDAGGTDCTDATGDPLATDQRGRPRVVDGNGDGTAACDIGAFEFFPIVNDLVALVGDVDTAFDPTPVAQGPAGTFTVTATFTNTSATPLRFPFFGVHQLTGDHLVLNADGAPGGVGATVTPEGAGDVLAPGAEVTAAFVIGLQAQAPFTFFVNVFGEPLP